jgi:hypothetical protein
MTLAPMRARTLALVSILVAVGALAVMLFFASQGGGERNDALLFLDRYEGLDVDDPIAERRDRIRRIAAMPLATRSVDEVRDLCVSAHETLIRAEERGAEARAIFDRATAGGVAEGDIPVEQRASIEAALEESNDALASARESMPRCMAGVRTLELRFAPQRAREP